MSKALEAREAAEWFARYEDLEESVGVDAGSLPEEIDAAAEAHEAEAMESGFGILIGCREWLGGYAEGLRDERLPID